VQSEIRKVLIVDDKLEWLCKCADLLAEHGFEVATCRNPQKALAEFREYKPDAVLLDIKMPGMNGLDLLRDMKAIDPWVAVIMLSAYGDSDTVVSAMKLGADHFVDKNSDMEKISICVKSELRKKRLELENIELKAEKGVRPVFIKDIIGECPEMLRVKQQVRDYADSDREVLLTGETGVGKDHVALALHFESKRRKEPFKNVSCPRLAPSLIESQLFGSEKGAYTGAYERKKGYIEAAGAGTLLLNEFADIPPHLQAKLLHVVENGIFTRVGGEGRDLQSHARFVGATNADPDKAVTAGELRQDLLWRLKKVWIDIPPLRERGDDIILLADHFLSHYSRKLGKPLVKLSEKSKKVLMSYTWPGNVRQLKSAMEAVAHAGRDHMDLGYTSVFDESGDGRKGKRPAKLKELVQQGKEAIEKREIIRALRKFNGSRKKAATHLDISYRDLLYKMKKYDLRDMF
jgi:DNA-binding NtrC family response regulator